MGSFLLGLVVIAAGLAFAIFLGVTLYQDKAAESARGVSVPDAKSKAA